MGDESRLPRRRSRDTAVAHPDRARPDRQRVVLWQSGERRAIRGPRSPLPNPPVTWRESGSFQCITGPSGIQSPEQGAHMHLETPQIPSVSAQGGPRPFWEIPPLWLQLPHMDKSFFAAEMPHTSNLNTFLSVLVYAGFATVCVLITSLGRLVLGENGS